MYVGTVGHELANHEISQHLHGGKIGHLGACEPWGYVVPVVAAVVTRATGVRHIYLICWGSLVNGKARAKVGFFWNIQITNSQSPGTRCVRGPRKSGSPTAELEVAAAAKTNSTT